MTKCDIILLGGFMSKIKVMDTILSNKIAAGEVVERCSSVVKELVENAIDAKSSIIKVELIESGTKSIKVIDNGIGMEKEDAVICFERHATSKLLDEEDLYRIDTLGFRGEALPSIASVSKVSLVTSTGNIGTSVIIEGGKIISVDSAEARKGTSIEVKDLFYNTPARLKHMKSLYTELASVTDYINKLALSYPNIQFILKNNNNIILNTDGSGNKLKTFSSVFGINTARKMIKINGENDDYYVDGYISLPEVQRSSRNHMIIIVNGRIVRNSELNRIINDAYHGYKPDNRYPIVMIDITVDPSLIDVNIHPTKMDIKFSKFDSLKELIEKLIVEALKPKTLIPKAEEKEEISYETEEITINDDFIVKDEPIKYEELKLDLSRTITPNVIPEKKDEKKEAEDATQRLPELYPLAAAFSTYIICQNEKGLYLIDQHAAKERINYEIVLKKLNDFNETKVSLLFPITIELTNTEYIILKENMNLLKEMKFDIEEFGINSIIVKSHPSWLVRFNEEEAIKKIIELVIQKEKNFDLNKFRDHVAATMACKMSIKAGDRITIAEMENLINDLRRCDNPFNCPHGRPTIVYYSLGDLEKMFKRSGFDNKK